MSRADQLGRSPELGANAGRRHFRDRFAAPDQRPGIGLDARTGFDRKRFARQGRLVEQDLPLEQPDIRPDHAAQRQLDQVSGHQLGRRHGLPHAVAPHRGDDRKARLQGIERRLGARFLEEPERGIEDDEHRDDRRLDILAVRELKHDRRFQHPWNRRPEFAERTAPRRRRGIRHRIRPERGPPAPRPFAREAGGGAAPDGV